MIGKETSFDLLKRSKFTLFYNSIKNLTLLDKDSKKQTFRGGVSLLIARFSGSFHSLNISSGSIESPFEVVIRVDHIAVQFFLFFTEVLGTCSAVTFLLFLNCWFVLSKLNWGGSTEPMNGYHINN